jgi:hypothetical protein
MWWGGMPGSVSRWGNEELSRAEWVGTKSVLFLTGIALACTYPSNHAGYMLALEYLGYILDIRLNKLHYEIILLASLNSVFNIATRKTEIFKSRRYHTSTGQCQSRWFLKFLERAMKTQIFPFVSLSLSLCLPFSLCLSCFRLLLQDLPLETLIHKKEPRLLPDPQWLLNAQSPFLSVSLASISAFTSNPHGLFPTFSMLLLSWARGVWGKVKQAPTCWE